MFIILPKCLQVLKKDHLTLYATQYIGTPITGCPDIEVPKSTIHLNKTCFDNWMNQYPYVLCLDVESCIYYASITGYVLRYSYTTQYPDFYVQILSFT